MTRLMATVLMTSALSCSQPIESVIEDAVGDLGVMQIVAESEKCDPPRAVGLTGRSFVGKQRSGRLVVVTPSDTFFGPSRPDAGVTSALPHTAFLNDFDVELPIGEDPQRRCARLRYRWTALGSTDGGTDQAFRLVQTWDQVDLGCPDRTRSVPESGCRSTRVFVFSPDAPCRLQCLAPTEELKCGC